MQNHELEALLELAVHEDFGENGDITTAALFDNERCSARLISKDTGILAGRSAFAQTFRYFDKNTEVRFHRNDGEVIAVGEHIASLQGKARSVLGAERTALNFLSFLSGIATQTHKAVSAAMEGGRAIILDTRKTMPGYRQLSKYAVKTGGGSNHRMGLYDMILIKDNHIDAVGSIAEAVKLTRRKWGSRYKIEVECRNLDEVKQALTQKVDILMLDNMDTDLIKQAVALAAGSLQLEASGNMDLQQIREISPTGVDYISVGMLTHSVKAFDFSLQIEIEHEQREPT